MAWTKAQAETATDALMFRELTDEEEAKMRQFAREHPDEVLSKMGLSHPVCRDEVRKMKENKP